MNIAFFLQILLLAYTVCAHQIKGKENTNCNFKKTPKDKSILERREKDNNHERNLQNIVPQKFRIKADVSALYTITDAPTRDFLIRTVDVTVQYFQDLIKVKKPVSKPIKLKENNCYEAYTYSEYQFNQVYPDIDLVIFVTQVTDKKQKYVAYATGCQQDETTGRNIVGLINFNAGYVKKFTNYDFQNQLLTTIHELFHVLVFDDDLFPFFINPKTGKSYDESFYKFDNIIKFPNIQKWVKNYYNCPTALGMQVEDDGSMGSAGSHWEFTSLLDDAMTPEGDDQLWSGLNNALLLDSGWYEVDLAFEDILTWGKNKGCEFLNRKCNSDKKFPEFCYNEEQGPTFSYHGKGYCTQIYWDKTCKIYDPAINIFGLGKNICLNPSSNDPNNKLNEVYGQDSRVFMSTLEPTTSGTASTLRCYQNECDKDGSVIYITFGTETFQCRESGQKIKSTKTDIKGELICPDIQSFCGKQQECPNYCNSNGYCIAGKCVCLPGITGSGCQCKIGQTDIKGKCVNCDENCNFCEQVDAKICTQCKDGFYLQNGKCIACQSPCKTCTLYNKNCLSCINNFYLSQNQCFKFTDSNCETPLNSSQCQKCISGKGLDSMGKCSLTCDSSCKTCNGTTTSCTSCPDGLTLMKSKCVCGDGYYYDSDKKQCTKCSLNCRICKDGKSCDQCTDLYSLNKVTNQCFTCPQGKYLKLDGTCDICIKSCGECGDNDPSNCLACKPYSKLVKGDYFYLCKCDEGYLENNEAGQCQSCINGISDGNYCRCNPGFYPDDFGICRRCAPGCTECHVKNSCLRCSPEYVLFEIYVSGSQVTGCNCDTAKGYKLNPTTKTCECTENQCKTQKFCENGFYTNGYCNCNKGYYLNTENVCEICPQKGCATCKYENDYVICIDCSPEYQFDQGECNKCSEGYKLSDSGICECNTPNCKQCPNGEMQNGFCYCKRGFYKDENNMCQACSHGCSYCSSFKKCDQCDKGYRLGLYTAQCDSCSGGYHLVDGKCKQPCEHGVIENGYCVCHVGYYMNSEALCQQCPPGCHDCSNDSSCDQCDPAYIMNKETQLCDSCNTGNGYTQTYKEVQPSDLRITQNFECVCKYGNVNKETHICELCPKNCISCSDQQTCNECKLLYKLKDNKCEECIDQCPKGADGSCTCPTSTCENGIMDEGDCQCNKGYFLKDKKCTKCSEHCEKCSNEEKCINCSKGYTLSKATEKCDSCNPGFTRNAKTSVCECQQNKFIDEQGNCVSCDVECLTCANKKEVCSIEVDVIFSSNLVYSILLTVLLAISF